MIVQPLPQSVGARLRGRGGGRSAPAYLVHVGLHRCVALDNLGGRARRRTIIDEARNVLGERLRPDDLKPVSQGKRLPRRRYRLGWALTQARHQHYVKKVPGERGIRELTPEGKQFAATERDRIDRGKL